MQERTFTEIYENREEAARARFAALTETFAVKFGISDGELSFFSSPGRTELIGNHTDHNGGRILAASVEMDTIAAAKKTDDGIITIWSEGYPDPIVVDTAALGDAPKCRGSVSLVAGICQAAKSFGRTVGGFSACVSTQVIPAAGVSSSASFSAYRGRRSLTTAHGSFMVMPPFPP